MKAFIDPHRDVYGVEPIGNVLPIAPSTDDLQVARESDPAQRSGRAQRDERLCGHIQPVWNENLQAYGADTVWRAWRREGVEVARCTVERLMRRLGLKGVRRGKPVKTTVSNPKAAGPEDRVNRPFTAERPNALWVSDFTEVSTAPGFVSVAFIVDGFARYLVGWKVSRSARTDVVRDALEQALCARPPFGPSRLIHPGDRGGPYGSIRSTERRAEAGIAPSVGSVGDSYDHALAETLHGLYKAEVIHRTSWQSLETVEWATLTWVDGFNHRRLLEPMGYIPPAEAEAAYYRQLTESARVA